MLYLSTRGGDCVTASQAILYGLAKDGGLYVPAVFPRITVSQIREMASLDYASRASSIFFALLEDYTADELTRALSQAYRTGRFTHDRIAPITEITRGTYILELYHGPTLAFKDFALQILPNLLKAAAHKNHEERQIIILVATSGDTGKAALEGFLNVPGMSCIVFYPKHGVSQIQERQMITMNGSNVHVIGIDGNFDDAQAGVKAILSSKPLNERLADHGMAFSSANSINLGRLLPQIVYYFSAYADLIDNSRIDIGDKVNFIVPTGNFGNILAGYYAKLMGLPIHKLICASNHNNVLTDFINTGHYSVKRPFYVTSSPSMDILVSSNIERLLFEVSDRNSDRVIEWMQQLTQNGSFQLSKRELDMLRETFAGGYADDRQTLEEIKHMYVAYQCLLDPHTAVASYVNTWYHHPENQKEPCIIVSTASPFKFPNTMLTALSDSSHFDDFMNLKTLSDITGHPIPDALCSLQRLPIKHQAVIGRDAVKDAIETILFPV